MERCHLHLEGDNKGTEHAYYRQRHCLLEVIASFARNIHPWPQCSINTDLTQNSS